MSNRTEKSTRVMRSTAAGSAPTEDPRCAGGAGERDRYFTTFIALMIGATGRAARFTTLPSLMTDRICR
jgi:hypothetical protein